MLTIGLLSVFSVAICAAQYFAYRRLRLHVERGLKVGLKSFRPKAAVILPCKGLDHDFKANVEKLLSQRYLEAGVNGKSNFEVIFAVASIDDPAYHVLTELAEKQQMVYTQVVVAGVNPQRAQKLNNQLEALKHVSADVEVLVFVDADVVARNDFLEHLVSGLADQTVGATTGYRFYVLHKLNYSSLLRSLWNRVSAWELASPSKCFAWGGAMAIRRSTFEQAKVLEAWQCAADDDLSLTSAVKRLGLKVYFVPQCLVASHGDTTFDEFSEWMNRQMILTKVYYPSLWWKAVARAGVLWLWLLAVAGCAAAGLVTHQSELLQASQIAVGTIVPFEVWMVMRAQRFWQSVLADYEFHLSRSLLATCLGIPLAHIVLPWMTLSSLFSNRIQWRGVEYELRSPTETVIV